MTAGYGKGEDVLSGLSLRQEGPGIVRVVGRNGEGKSTLVELISGYLRPRRGSVLVDGRPAHSEQARRRRRVCRSHPALYGDMTVRDHLVFAARCAGSPASLAVSRFADYGGGEWLESRACELSAGNARKLWIVMCTQGEFDLVALDEPFSGLDALGTETLVGELREWARSSLVLLVTHHLPVGVEPRRVIEVGSTSTSPASPTSPTATNSSDGAELAW